MLMSSAQEHDDNPAYTLGLQQVSDTELANHAPVKTVRKWHRHTTMHDASHMTHQRPLHTALEKLVISLRIQLLSLNELLAVV